MVTLSSCSDFLEENPKNFLSPDNFFKSSSEAVLAVNGCYDALATQEGWGLYRVNMHIVDQGTSVCGTRQSSDSQGGIGNYTATYDHSVFKQIFQLHYKAISKSNMVIDRVEAMDIMQDKISADLKKRVVAEAKFIRALSYFNLVRYYGGVPLILNETKDMQDLFVERNTIQEVYTQIITDLDYAAENLYYRVGSNIEGEKIYKIFITQDTICMRIDWAFDNVVSFSDLESEFNKEKTYKYGFTKK